MLWTTFSVLFSAGGPGAVMGGAGGRFMPDAAPEGGFVGCCGPLAAEATLPIFCKGRLKLLNRPRVQPKLLCSSLKNRNEAVRARPVGLCRKQCM